jgi:hypothetical protein
MGEVKSDYWVHEEEIQNSPLKGFQVQPKK